MDEKAYAIFLVGVYGDTEDAAFGLIECTPDFDDELAVYLEENPPRASDDLAISKFWNSGLQEQHDIELAPMPDMDDWTPYTRASFARARLLGVEVIVGRYW